MGRGGFWRPAVTGAGGTGHCGFTVRAPAHRLGVRPARRTHDGATPLLLLHDGQVWAKYLNLKATLDTAISTGAIPALHVAMIDSLDSANPLRGAGRAYRNRGLCG